MDVGAVKKRLMELSERYLDRKITDAEFFQELMREIYTSEHRSRALDLIAYALVDKDVPEEK